MPDAIAPSDELRAEIDFLGRELESRASVTWLARAFICGCAGVVSFGLAMRLLADAVRLHQLFWLALAMFLATTGFTFFAYLRGRSLLPVERQRFARLRRLRSEAGLG